MVRDVLRRLVWVVVIIVVLIWLIGGGIQKIVSVAGSIHAYTWSDFARGVPSALPGHLPWQPNFQSVTVTIPGLSQYAQENPGPPQLGSLSRYASEISLSPGLAGLEDPSAQYVVVTNTSATAVTLNGWSLQSALSGVRVFIPEAASPLVVGRVNSVRAITLAPGASIVASTGFSPVGVSFQENVCSGYLGTLQRFSPPLFSSCPPPSAMLPNADRFGAACGAYVSSAAPCVFPLNPPPTLSAQCRAAVQTTLSYNGCVNLYGNSPSFEQPSWRVYFSESAPLWGGHDTIRLLDGDEGVVAALSY